MINKRLLFAIIPCLFIFTSFAHTINYALEDAPLKEVSSFYFWLGFRHILPEGLDHVLFIIGICLINKKIKPIIWQATAFTIAHTIALALSMKNVIAAPAGIIEPIIAASIVFVAIENLLLQKMKPWRLLLIFGFGLVHGMGFASSLNDIGLPRDTFYTSIGMFNLGVEICQLLVIGMVYFLLIKPFHQYAWYRKGIVFPVSLIIAVVSSYWMLERLSVL
jgi:hydrogenase/urease accessory protein HupE